MRASLLSLALAASLALPATVAAQAESLRNVGDCGATEKDATIRGVLVDSAGAPVVSRRVVTWETQCGRVYSDSAGRFELRNVPPGPLQITVRTPTYWNRFRVRTVKVAPGRDTAVEVRLERATSLTDCQDEPRCAALLEAHPAAFAALSDAERLREAMLRTSIALAGLDGGWPPRWVPCLEREKPAVVAALRARFPGVVDGDACRLPAGDSNHRRLRHEPTGLSARHIYFRIRSREGDTVTSGVGDYVGPLSAREYRCVFQRVDGRWVARWCDLESIS